MGGGPPRRVCAFGFDESVGFQTCSLVPRTTFVKRKKCSCPGHQAQHDSDRGPNNSLSIAFPALLVSLGTPRCLLSTEKLRNCSGLGHPVGDQRLECCDGHADGLKRNVYRSSWKAAGGPGGAGKSWGWSGAGPARANHPSGPAPWSACTCPSRHARALGPGLGPAHVNAA